MLNHLGNPQPFFPEGTALGERAQFGMARGQVGTGVHDGEDNLAEALIDRKSTRLNSSHRL